jgi:hypothetical protein
MMTLISWTNKFIEMLIMLVKIRKSFFGDVAFG